MAISIQGETQEARKPHRGTVWFMIYEGKDKSVNAQVSGSKNGGEPGCRLFREGAGSPEYRGFRDVGRFQMHFRRLFNGNQWVEYRRKRKERNIEGISGTWLGYMEGMPFTKEETWDVYSHFPQS